MINDSGWLCVVQSFSGNQLVSQLSPHKAVRGIFPNTNYKGRAHQNNHNTIKDSVFIPLAFLVTFFFIGTFHTEFDRKYKWAHVPC